MIDLTEIERKLEKKTELLGKKLAARELARIKAAAAYEVFQRYNQAAIAINRQIRRLESDIQDMSVELDQENAACNDHYARP